MPLPVPNQFDVQTILAAFLTDIIPTDIPIVEGQDNRVPTPINENFLTITVARRERLETNTDQQADAAYIGSVTGTALTVTSIIQGQIKIGATLFGVGVTAGTKIIAYQSGTPGGVGVYTVSPSQTVASGKLASGQTEVLQPTRIVYLIGVFGDRSADVAQTISTLFRDPYATEFFSALSDTVAPLYADDPKQVPFTTDSNQYMDRYVVEAHIQANQVVTVPQQYADVVDLDVIQVEATFPP